MHQPGPPSEMQNFLSQLLGMLLADSLQCLAVWGTASDAAQLHPHSEVAWKAGGKGRSHNEESFKQ